MTGCLTEPDIAGLLSDALSEAEERRVNEHLQTCPDCRASLDRYTAAPDPLRQALGQASAGTMPKVDEFLRQVGDKARPGRIPASDTVRPSGEFTSTPAGPGDRSETSLPRLPGYEILEEIDRGGMGVVYKARQTALKRIVALKMIKSGRFADREQIQRFLAEAEAAAALEHPHIVPIYEVGESLGQHYYTMGFVDGATLGVLIKETPLPSDVAARVVRTVAEAVQFAHDQGIIHRDLKPGNVLIDDEGKPRVTDFGLAKNVEVDSGMTSTGQIIGTPNYMSPEQAGGNADEIGPPSDVYGLGAMLYASLTGRPPFQAAGVLETLRQVTDSDPVSPRTLNADVDKDLETVCLKCLEKSPERRYGSAQELADELGRYLEHKPILARPATPPRGRCAMVPKESAGSAGGGVVVGSRDRRADRCLQPDATRRTDTRYEHTPHKQPQSRNRRQKPREKK